MITMFSIAVVAVVEGSVGRDSGGHDGDGGAGMFVCFI